MLRLPAAIHTAEGSLLGSSELFASGVKALASTLWVLKRTADLNPGRFAIGFDSFLIAA